MNYIDLGLPSGTLWCDINEDGYYTFDEAVEKYGDSLPTKEQFEELKDQCKWEWNGSGYNVTGHNGNSIILPAAGFRNYYGNEHGVGGSGYYWSSAPFGSDNACALNFGDGGVSMFDCRHWHGFSVRLVK